MSNKQANHQSNMSNANKGTSGTNKTYSQNQGNRGWQMNPQNPANSGKGKKIAIALPINGDIILGIAILIGILGVLWKTNKPKRQKHNLKRQRKNHLSRRENSLGWH
ncbi:hypothetical protein [Neisseria gonorrhoeae]